MAALLALTAAAAYGAGDFLGGVASRRVPATAVVLWSHIVGLLLLVMAAPLLGGEPTLRALGMGAVGGVVGGAGVTLFFKGLSIGKMSVVAPVAALLAGAVPVLAGIWSGERPGAATLAGLGVAFVAVTLVSREDDDPNRTGSPGSLAGARGQSLLLALGAGLAFGLFFVAVDVAGTDAGIWPLVAARVASVTLFGSLAAARVIEAAPPRVALGAAVGSGVLDASANALYLLALSHGLLSVVAGLTALYPAGTVILARYLLGERMTPVQHTGLACAGVAAVLIAA